MPELIAETEVVIDLTDRRDAPAPPTVRRFLVLGDGAVDSPELAWALHARVGRRATALHLVVPAAPVPSAQLAMIRHEHLARPHETPGVGLARFRLARAMHLLRDLGLHASGDVGPPDPLSAIEEAVRHADFDEVLVPIAPTARRRHRSVAVMRRIRRHCDVTVSPIDLTGS